ncbi:MAG: acyltransferase family protein, partial [Acidimicrobiales bacterium]
MILWHAFGVAAITHALSAVPAMFFVTGSLLAKSLSHRPAGVVLVDRARRLLAPLAAFSAVSVVVMAAAWVRSPSEATALPWRGLVLWFLPFADPAGSAWEGGYLSSPLWYLRVLLWLVVLSPLLLRAFRRRPGLALAAPVVAVGLLEWVGRHPGWAVPWLPDLVWQAGDIALYAVFLLLGFAHRDGLLERITARYWLGLSAVTGLGAAGWMLTQPVPGMVVNNSHPAHLLAGVAWLGLLLAGRQALDRLARARRSGAVVAWVTQRTMTIYLWHAAALVITRHALRRAGHLPYGLWSVGLLAGAAAVMTLLVLAFGWVEDVAG